MLGLIKRINSRVDSHMREVIGSAIVVMPMKAVAAVLQFTLSLALAWIYGAEGAGMFFLAYTLTMMTATISLVGFSNVVVRHTASFKALDQTEAVYSVYKTAVVTVLATSFTAAVIVYGLGPLIAPAIVDNAGLSNVLPLLFIALPMMALVMIHAEMLRGAGQLAGSILIQSIVIPFATIAGALWLGKSSGAEGAIMAFAVATAVAMFIGAILWRQCATPSAAWFSLRSLLDSSLPLLVVVVCNQLISWAPLLLLGVFESRAIVGVYGVADRVAMAITLVLYAMNILLAPKLAALHKLDDTRALEKVARHTAGIVTIFALPVAVGLTLFPTEVLGVFGDEFKIGAFALIVLAVAQLINVATGSVGLVLMMTANERALRNNVAFAGVLCLIVAIALIPPYGLEGAAIATAVGVIAKNIASLVYVRRRLGLRIVPFFP
ncbi:MAG: oligosaccharide flippase family protein [Gammaproteobacteria bacterium]|nr:oligosaccharide flippase family protein [Gammaproteobacteria bacterium]